MESLPTQLAQLESAQFVRRLADEEFAYLFKHTLTQEVAYQSLLLKTRREIHREVAAAYERLDADQTTAEMLRERCAMVSSRRPSRANTTLPRSDDLRAGKPVIWWTTWGRCINAQSLRAPPPARR